MPKYNELYNKFDRNLNKLLAWYHGKSLNQALDQRAAPWGLLDQFTKQKLGRCLRQRPQRFQAREPNESRV
jgi:ribonuclease HIII